MLLSEGSLLSALVKRLEGFVPLSNEVRGAVLSLPAQRVAVRRGKDLIKINKVTTDCYLILSGNLGHFGQALNGSRQFVAFHLPGELANLHCAVSASEGSGLTALCDTTAISIDQAKLRALAGQYPSIAEALWRDSMLSASICSQWVLNVGRRDAFTRLAHLICEMSVRLSDGDEPLQEFAWQITQEQLGDATSLTSVHVNRSLSLLRKEGLATVNRGKVKIIDWPSLAKRGDFQGSYLLKK